MIDKRHFRSDTFKTGSGRALAVLVFSLAVQIASAEEEPTDGQPFSVVSVLRHEEALRGAHDVELSGNLAFVPGKGGTLAIVDITDHDKPKLLWLRNDPEYLADSETVLPIGKHLLLGTRDFFSMDVSSPEEPVFLKKIAQRDQGRIDRINGMVRRGNYVFAANKAGWIDAFDISDVTAPKLFGALNVGKESDLRQPHDIDMFGDFIAICSPNGFGKQPGKVGIFLVTDPKTHEPLPADHWSLEGKVVSTKLSGANRLQISGTFAYTGNSFHPGNISTDNAILGVTDISNPKQPKVVASVPFPYEDRGANGLTIAGNVVFLAGGQSILAIDITDPRQPKMLAAWKRPSPQANGREDERKHPDNLHDLVYRDEHLYVSCQTDHAFMILRVNNKQIRDLADDG